MRVTAFYNEIEKYPAAWMRNLIDAKHIAGGTVEERSIVELTPRDVDGFTQAHFFAGIGLWSLALRMAGWPDDLPVWTGSCPCQPFSAAGKRKGKDDARHLWPSWYSLIKECRPPVIFGEQVASDDGLDWFATVHADLEGAGYAVGGFDLSAAGLGAFHIRQRLYFVAIADSERRDWQQVLLQPWGSLQESVEASRRGGVARPLADTYARVGRRLQELSLEGVSQVGPQVVVENAADQLSYADAIGTWRQAEWVMCLDERYRAVPVEPEFFPLAVRRPGDVGKLRAYGNAISPPVAATFVRAVMESL